MDTVIAGSRSITDKAVVMGNIEAIKYYMMVNGFGITKVIEGEAGGVDKIARVWAEANDIEVDPRPAAWNDLSHPDARIKTGKNGVKYDANAGHRRNIEMINDAECAIFIWDGESPGTGQGIQYAKLKSEANHKFVIYLCLHARSRPNNHGIYKYMKGLLVGRIDQS